LKILLLKFFQEIYLTGIKLKVAIIGAGINGLFTSYVLSQNGYQVDLFDSNKALSQTSSSSSKLLHGGIRYLEFGHLSLVRESLLDRHWWLINAPEYCTPFEMHIPIYKNTNRSILKLLVGAFLYNILAGKYSLGSSKWNPSKNSQKLLNEIRNTDFKGSVSFYDLQMDEAGLGLWVKKNAIRSGVKIFENMPIRKFDVNGNLQLPNGDSKSYDFILNIAGPWSAELNRLNMINTDFDLELIRGSHLFIDRPISNFYLLQESAGQRVIFVMPYDGQTLIGTTEVTQDLHDPISCSSEESEYLLNIYNNFFEKKLTVNDIKKTFSGLRPIINNTKKRQKFFVPSMASREMKIFDENRLISLYGGKWTSAPSTARKILKKIQSINI
jgi:glycerol-3-phosphate dehydrogenase